jgi:hypothetical protein
MLKGYYQSRSLSCLSLLKAYDLLTYGLVDTIAATDAPFPLEWFRRVRIGIRTLKDSMARRVYAEIA